MKKGNLKRETERLIMAAQDQAIHANWVKANIDKVQASALCQVCCKQDETISYVRSECKQLAQNEYRKWRHNKIATILHWSLCKQYGFEHSMKYYEHFVKKENKVLENERVKIIWDVSIQTERMIDHNKPDIVVIKKEDKMCYVIDVACLLASRIQKKEKETIDSTMT